MRIGIDIDDTITNSYNRILSEFEKYYNINKYMYMNSGISYYDIMKDKETFPDYYDYCKLLLELNKEEEFWHIIDIMESTVKSLDFTNLQLRIISLKIKPKP